MTERLNRAELREVRVIRGLFWWLSSKESACSVGAVGDVGLNPGWGRSPGGEHGNARQYSCLENPTDRGAWRATAQGLQRVGHD